MGLGTKKESAWFFCSTPSYSPILFYSGTITYSQPVNYFTHKKSGSFVNVDHDLKTKKKPFQISDAQFKKYPDQGIVSVQL